MAKSRKSVDRAANTIRKLGVCEHFQLDYLRIERLSTAVDFYLVGKRCTYGREPLLPIQNAFITVGVDDYVDCRDVQFAQDCID